MLHRPPRAPDEPTAEDVGTDSVRLRPDRRKRWFAASQPMAVDDDPAWNNTGKRPPRKHARRRKPPETPAGGG